MIFSSFKWQAVSFMQRNAGQNWSKEKLVDACMVYLYGHMREYGFHAKEYAQNIAVQALAHREALKTQAYINLEYTTEDALFIRNAYIGARWVLSIADIMKLLESSALVSLPIPSKVSLTKCVHDTPSETGAA